MASAEATQGNAKKSRVLVSPPGHQSSAETMSGVKRKRAAAAGTRALVASTARGVRSVGGFVREMRAAAVGATLREVRAYMQDHAGRLPSQGDPEARKLYYEFRYLRRHPMLNARARSHLRAISCGARNSYYSLKRLSFGRGDSSQECPLLSHGERRGRGEQRPACRSASRLRRMQQPDNHGEA